MADPASTAKLRQAALLFYRCSQREADPYMRELFLAYYASTLYSVGENSNDARAKALATKAAMPLHTSDFDDVRMLVANITTRGAKQGAPAVAATIDPTVACRQSRFGETVLQWENDFRAYAYATDATASTYKQALQESQGTYTVPYNLSPAWRNLLTTVANGAQQSANQQAAATVQQAFAHERDLLAALNDDEQAVIKAQAALHATGPTQTDVLSAQIVRDIEAITQYSRSFTAEGHVGQSGNDDLQHIKSSKLDYDDAVRQLAELPYCRK